jgi:hypothetical protein
LQTKQSFHTKMMQDPLHVSADVSHYQVGQYKGITRTVTALKGTRDVMNPTLILKPTNFWQQRASTRMHACTNSYTGIAHILSHLL